jgi:hypothetical protein
MAADPNAEDYELTEALLPPEERADGLSKPKEQEAQLPAEGRKGDTFALYLALVSVPLMKHVRTKLMVS